MSDMPRPELDPSSASFDDQLGNEVDELVEHMQEPGVIEAVDEVFRRGTTSTSEDMTDNTN